MITLAMTTFQRYSLVLEALEKVLHDPRISEVVLVDDHSEDGSFESLQKEFANERKVYVWQNERNVDCYANKAHAVELATNPWVLLFDSDNVMDVSYLDALWRVQPWDRKVAYLPTFAQPEFDYREFAGLTVERSNVADFMGNDTFKTALNTANHFFWGEEYLRCFDRSVDPHTSDSIYMNFKWLEAGNKLYFVPGMEYFHRIHDGSHFVLNDHKTGEFARKVEALLGMLR